MTAALVAGCAVVLLVAGLGRLARAPVRSVSAPPGARRPRRPGPLARHPLGRALAARLARAAIPLSPGAFVAVVALGALAAGTLAWLVMAAPLVVPAVSGGVVVAAAAAVRSGDGRRAARITAQLPQVVQSIAASLSAGLSLRQALVRSARDAPEPLVGELVTLVDQLALGARLENALEGLASRVPSRDVRVVVTAIMVQRRTGGNLARALAQLAERLDERGRLARELRGATAQARLTAWLVAALPLAAGVMAEIAAPGTLRGALGQPPGPLLCLVAGVMYGVGVVWVKRIGSVEP